MLIIKVEQNSEQWWAEKLGKPSASRVKMIIKNDGTKSDQRKGYLYELAGEIITGKREEGYKNSNMEMGNEREAEARALYEMIHEVKVRQVGVVYKDEAKQFLCSPDGLIDDYGLELKNVIPKTQVKRLIDNRLPSEYFGQIQFSLYVTGFKFWDFMSYCPAMKPLIIRVKRDEKYIGVLGIELEKFCNELKEIVEKIK